MAVVEHRAHWEFSADVLAPERARHFTADSLMAWGADHFCAESLLIVSELVTNAVNHGRSPASLDLRYDGVRLRIGVSDTGPEQPEIRAWHHDAAGGLGLRLIDAVAGRWYVEVNEDGKTICCDLVDAHHDEAREHLEPFEWL